MAWFRRSKRVWDTCGRNIGSCSKTRVQESISTLIGSNTELSSINLKQKGYKYKRWIAGLGLAGVVYATNQETVPYSKRTHLVLLPRFLENKLLGKFQYTFYKSLNNWHVFPATHPASVRVKRIADNVIEAAKKGLREQNYDSSYLDYFEWEVGVVDRPEGRAQCLAAGRIVVYRGFVEEFESDAELAAIIAHEVGHAIARHNVELSGKAVALVLLFRYLLPRKIRNPVSTLSLTALAHLPTLRKAEREADYIGMLLMASAGYDPRAAITVEHKLGSSHCSDFFCTHPSQQKTLQYLGEAQDEAMVLYRETLSNP